MFDSFYSKVSLQKCNFQSNFVHIYFLEVPLFAVYFIRICQSLFLRIAFAFCSPLDHQTVCLTEASRFVLCCKTRKKKQTRIITWKTKQCFDAKSQACNYKLGISEESFIFNPLPTFMSKAISTAGFSFQTNIFNPSVLSLLPSPTWVLNILKAFNVCLFQNSLVIIFLTIARRTAVVRHSNADPQAMNN